jgi:hypothetical protein
MNPALAWNEPTHEVDERDAVHQQRETIAKRWNGFSLLNEDGFVAVRYSSLRPIVEKRLRRSFQAFVCPRSCDSDIMFVRSVSQNSRAAFRHDLSKTTTTTGE